MADAEHIVDVTTVKSAATGTPTVTGKKERWLMRCLITACVLTLVAIIVFGSFLLAHVRFGPMPRMPDNVCPEVEQRVLRFVDYVESLKSSPVVQNRSNHESYLRAVDPDLDVSNMTAMELVDVVTDSLTTQELIERDLWLDEADIDQLTGREPRNKSESDVPMAVSASDEAASGDDAASGDAAASGDESVTGGVAATDTNATTQGNRRALRPISVGVNWAHADAVDGCGGVDFNSHSRDREVKFTFMPSVGDPAKRAFWKAAKRVEAEIGGCLTFREMPELRPGVIKVWFQGYPTLELSLSSSGELDLEENQACLASVPGCNEQNLHMKLTSFCDRENAEDQTTIMHEIGHALGMYHEHQRPDRDRYVHVPPKFSREDPVNYKIENKMDTSLPYDLTSIMHYGGGCRQNPCTRSWRFWKWELFKVCSCRAWPPGCSCNWNRYAVHRWVTECNDDECGEDKMHARDNKKMGRKTGGFSANDIAQIKKMYQCDHWKAITPGTVRQLTVDGDWVYGVGTDLNVYRHRKDGSGHWCQNYYVRWCHMTPGSVRQIVIDGEYVYGVGTDLNVYRHRKDGSDRWRRMTPGSGSVTQITIDGEYIYGVGTDLNVYRHKKDGSDRWYRMTPGSVRQITIDGARIYGIGMDGRVYRHNKDGIGEWHRHADPASTWIETDGQGIYATGTDGRVYKWM